MNDFFISYNKADCQIALWIAQQLQAAGYSTIIQAEDMPPGSNFVREMDKACKEARQIILVLSPDYLTSEYTQPEWHPFFRQDPTGDKRLLVPVRVRECQPEGLLAQIVWIDLAGKDGEAAKAALLAGIRLSRTQAQLPVRLLVDELIEQYCERLAEKVSRVRIFGDEQTRPLDQVFVELTINEEYERRPNQAEFLGLMDSELRRMRSVFGDADERSRDREGVGDFDPRAVAKTKRTIKRTIKPDDLLRSHPHAIVTGAPGCGKTTLLRYLAWQTLKQFVVQFVVPPSGGSGGFSRPARLVNEPLPPEGGTTNARFPVFLELKQLTAAAFQQSQGQLEELLFAAGIAARLKPSKAESETLKGYFFNLLREGRVAVFLDGLDEVSGAKFFGDLQRSVTDFLHSDYGNNTVIISTRPFALRQFGDAKAMEIQPLSPRQIEQFIEHYYQDVPERQQFQRELQRRRELRELARVPALLGFILQLWRKQGTVTDDKLELYAQITLELAAQLDREKEGIAPEREWRIDDKSGMLKRDFLRQLAFSRMFQGIAEKPYDLEHKINDTERIVFTGDNLIAEAEKFAAARYQRTGIALDPYGLAEDVKATALLRQVGTDHYAFAHLTLQEYLAAWQLAKGDNGDTCERIFCRAYFNPMLAEMEVLPITLGLVGEPDKLYDALEQLPESSNLQRLRAQARGLAYVGEISVCWLRIIVNEILRGLTSQEVTDHTSDLLSLSLSSARSSHKSTIVDTVSKTITDETSTLKLISLLQIIGGYKAVEILSGLTVNKKTSGFTSAIYSLGLVNELEADRRLLEMLESKDASIRSYVIDALGMYANETTKDGLVGALRDDYSDNRWRAAEGLSKIPGAYVTAALIPLLKDEDWYVRRRVVTILGRRKDKTATMALLQALDDEDNRVAAEAAKSLAQIGNELMLRDEKFSGRLD